MTDKFAKEVDLCAAFIAAVDKRVWTPYAETGGYDIVLVRKADGFQIGIQAKLRFNIDVVLQIIHHDYWPDIEAPDCRAILVPHDAADRGLGALTDYIGITVIRQDVRGSYGRIATFRPDLPTERFANWSPRDEWFDLCVHKRITLPEYVPDARHAGSPAPIQLTEWKIKAIKLAITLERRGYVTREDFSHLKLDHRRWYARDYGWLVMKKGRMVAGPGFPKVKQQHPEVWKKIAKDFDKWALKTLA